MLVYDYSKLKGRIVEKLGTQGAFAEQMNMTGVAVSKRLNNKIPWRQEEIEKAAEILGIRENEILKFFFKRRKPATMAS